MLVKFSIDGYTSKNALLDALTENAQKAIAPLLATCGKISDKQLQERAYYNAPVATVNGTLKSISTHTPHARRDRKMLCFCGFTPL